MTQDTRGKSHIGWRKKTRRRMGKRHRSETEIIYTSPPSSSALSLFVTLPPLHTARLSTGLVISHYTRSHSGNWAMQSRGTRGGRGGTVTCISHHLLKPISHSKQLHLLHLYLDSINADILQHTRQPRTSQESSGTWSLRL